MPRVVYQGISLGIEPRVASGSVHSLRLSRVRVRESLEGCKVYDLYWLNSIAKHSMIVLVVA